MVICAYKSNCPNVLAVIDIDQLNTVNYPLYNKYLGLVKVAALVVFGVSVICYWVYLSFS